jgi:hypothetical protein
VSAMSSVGLWQTALELENSCLVLSQQNC